MPWGMPYGGGASVPPAVQDQQQGGWGQRAYDWLADRGRIGQFFAGMFDTNDDQRFGLRDAGTFVSALAAGGPMGLLAAAGREAVSDNFGQGRGIDLFGRRDEPNPSRPTTQREPPILNAPPQEQMNRVDPSQGSEPGSQREYRGYTGPPIFGSMFDASWGGNTGGNPAWEPSSTGRQSDGSARGFSAAVSMMGGIDGMARNRLQSYQADAAAGRPLGSSGRAQGLFGGYMNPTMPGSQPSPGYNPMAPMEPDPSMPGVFPGGYRQGNQALVPHQGPYPYYDPAGIPPLPPGMTRHAINPYLSGDSSYQIPVAGSNVSIPVIQGPQWLGPPGLPGWSMG